MRDGGFASIAMHLQRVRFYLILPNYALLMHRQRLPPPIVLAFVHRDEGVPFFNTTRP